MNAHIDEKGQVVVPVDIGDLTAAIIARHTPANAEHAQGCAQRG